ncbi:dnaJ, partial [Symbiodinium sp. CCMP2456]
GGHQQRRRRLQRLCQPLRALFAATRADEQDAEARSQHWWSSRGTRAQQRDRAATAAEEPPKTVRAQNPRMRREERLRKKQKLQERQDESVMEWDAFLKRTKNGKDKDTFGQQKRTRPA